MGTARLRLAGILHPQDNNFALLRFCAAAAVVVSHAFQIGTGDGHAQPLGGPTSFNLGQHAVNVFFVMSGLMVAGSLERSSSLVDFANARALRLLPGLAICALVLAFLIGPLVSDLAFADYARDANAWAYPARVISLIGAGAPLPGVFATSPVPHIVNEPLWTLKYEVACYGLLFLISALGIWSSRRLFIAVAALSALAGALMMIAKPFPDLATPIDHLARLWFCFLVGIAAYRWRARVPLSLPLVAMLGLGFWLARGGRLELVAAILFTGYAALLAAAAPTGRLRHLANRTDLSFGIYIVGWPVTQLIVMAAPGIAIAPLAILALGASAAVAFLSWRLVERPALDARRAVTPHFEAVARAMGLRRLAPAAPTSPAPF